MPRVHGPDERRPLDPGTRIGDALLVLKLSATGSAGFSYEGLSLRDQSNVTLVECCPVGVAVRGDDTSVNAIRGWEQDFADRLAAFERRATLLQAHPHPALEVCGETIAALGTRFVCQSIDAASPMDDWSNTLFKRASAPDLEAIAGRIASALLALYDQGLGHGAVSVATIRLTTPADARLSGLMLSECDAGSAVADMHGLAQILYAQVTGRSAPPPDRDRSLDAGRSAHHIAAGDYPDALLQKIDAALGLDGGTSEPDARDWLAGVAGWAAAPAAVPKPAPEAPRQTPQPAEPSLSRTPNPAC